ncbi:fumarylacetoacetate hydrolase family protein [Streptomyces anulatus]
MRPWIVTADELGAPYRLTMTARINSEESSRCTSADMHHTFADMIAFASSSTGCRRRGPVLGHRAHRMRPGARPFPGTRRHHETRSLRPGRAAQPARVMNREVLILGVGATPLRPPPRPQCR